MRWADDRALVSLHGAPALPPKALELYAHILGAEHVWLSRLRQERATTAVWPALSATQCRDLAAANHAGFAELLSRLDAESLGREIPYTNSAGIAFRSTVEDILLHVVLHGCYHRGQVALALREAGAEPFPTDFIAFVRGAPAATRTP